MKNSDILFIVNSYYALKGKEAVALPASVAWKRRLNLKDLIGASETINEALQELSSKYNDDTHSMSKKIVDANGKETDAKVVKPEYLTEFVEAQQEILSQDTDVTIRKIKIGELDGVALSDEMLDTIDFMIEEE